MIGMLVVGIGTIVSSINGSIEPSKVGLASTYIMQVNLFRKFYGLKVEWAYSWIRFWGTQLENKTKKRALRFQNIKFETVV